MKNSRNKTGGDGRSNSGREIVCGRQPVAEVLRAGRRTVFRVLLAERQELPEEVKPCLQPSGAKPVTVVSVPRMSLDHMTGDAHHQGIAVEVSDYPYVPEQDMERIIREKNERVFVVCLDHIQDPQNLGSLLRTAECMGVDLVAIPADRAAGVTPAVVRASSGASEHLQVCRVVNLARSMRSMKELGVWFYGMEAIESAQCLTKTDFGGAVGLVIGSEGEGLGRLIRETCDHLVRIPMEGKIGSLNAGTAGAMVMYEVRRQKLKADPIQPLASV